MQGQIDRLRNGATYAIDLVEGLQDGGVQDELARRLGEEAQNVVERQTDPGAEPEPGIIDRGSDFVARQWRRLRDLLGSGGP